MEWTLETSFVGVGLTLADSTTRPSESKPGVGRDACVAIGTPLFAAIRILFLFISMFKPKNNLE
jgi:hypothetical protein